MSDKSKQEPELLWLLEQTKLYYFEGFGGYKFDEPDPNFDFNVSLNTIHELAKKWITDASNYFKCPKQPNLQFYQRYKEPIGLIFGELLIIPTSTEGVSWEFTLLESRRDIRMPVILELTLKFENEGRACIEQFINDYPKPLRHFLEYRVKPRFLDDDKILAPMPLNPTTFEQLKGYFTEREEVNCQFEFYYDFNWKSTLQTINYAVRNMFAIYDSIVAVNDSGKKPDLLLEYYLTVTKRLKNRTR